MFLPLFIFSLSFTLESGAGSPVDRKRNIESLDNDSVQSYDIIDVAEAEDLVLVEKRMFSSLGLFEDNDEDYALESDISIYESIKDEKYSILTKIERLYNTFKSHQVHHDHNHDLPLLSIASTEPQSITIMIKPRQLKPDTMIHLQYERVPMHRQPAINHMDDPVEEYIPLIRISQTFTMTSLPQGKYIVCGEALDQKGKVYQESCLETRIRKEKRKGLQSGVKALIMISMMIMVGVIIYAILYQLCAKLCGSPPDKN